MPKKTPIRALGVTTVTDPNSHTTTYGHDNANRLPSLTDRTGRQTTYSYDAAGNRTGETWVGGNCTATYTYDAANRLTNETDSFSTYALGYDNANDLTSVDNSGTPGAPHVVLSYAFDGFDRRAKLTDSLSTSAGINYAYDTDNRISQISMTSSGFNNGHPLVTYGYDAASRLTSMTRSLPTSGFSGSGNSSSTTYGYDNANRLNGITHSPLTAHNSPHTLQPPLTTHDSPLTPSFGSVEVGFTGYLARNQLAHLSYGKGMHAEAEAEWRKAVDERPDFLPAWLGLGELYLAQGRLEELDAVVKQFLEPSRGRELPEADKNEGLVLKARGLLARKDYEPARSILEEISARNPRWVYPKVILSHVLLQEGKDPAAAERVLREIVDLDPSQAESWRNLAVLFRHQGKLAQSAGVCRSARLHCPQDIELLLLQGIVLRETGELPEAETYLVSVISQARPEAKSRQRGQEARHQLALLYIQAGRFNEAEAQWREVLAECPDHGPARQGLDSLQRQRNRKQEVLSAVS